MKFLTKPWVRRACNFCIVLGGFLHFTKVSFLLFGEEAYPAEKDFSAEQ